MRAAGEASVWRSASGRIRWGWRVALFTLLFLALLLTLNQVAAWLDAPWMSGEWDPRTWGWLTAVVAVLAASWWMAEGVEDVPMAALGLPLDGGTTGELLRGTALGVGLMAVAVAVLALAGWVTWEGLRNGTREDEGPSNSDSPPPPDVEIRTPKDRTKRKKKRRGHINWIQ